MSDPLKLVKVDLARVTRLHLLVPADVDDELVARAVEIYYDGTTLYGEEEKGCSVLRRDNSVRNDAEVAESEPAEDVGADTTRAVQDYWHWVAEQTEVTA